MAKYFCPFLGQEVDGEIDLYSPSKEHIVPAGLGGANAFSIDNVSTKANNDLGTTVDAPFINDPLVAMQLHSLNIRDRSGNPHQLRWSNGEVDHDGRVLKVSMLHSADDGWSYDFKNRKEEVRDPATGKTRVTMIAKPEEANNVIRKVVERYQKKGLIVEVHPSQEIELQQPDLKTEFSIDQSVYARQFVKIALGSAVLNAGSDFEKSSDAGRLREMLWNRGGGAASGLQKIIDRGFWGFEDVPAFQYLKRNHDHVITFMYLDKQVVCVVLLFGVWLGMVGVASDQQTADLFQLEVFYQIDPVQRSLVVHHTMMDFMKPF